MQGETIDHIQAPAGPVKQSPGKAFSTQSIASTKSIKEDLTSLSQELAAFKRHGNPPFVDIQSFAERIWKANLSYEAAIAKLDREKKMLTKQIDTIWGSFDTLIRPLWRVDDAIVPVYDALADIRIRLEDLLQQKLEAITTPSATAISMIDDEVVLVQKSLHELERKHVVDGKFVGEGWKTGMKIPSGQAVVANLLAKDYRLVRMIQEAEGVAVDKSLLPVQLLLESIIHALRRFKVELFGNLPVDPLELATIQSQLDGIGMLEKDGKFITPDSSTGAPTIPKGQAVLTEMMESAYDLIHICLVEMETRERRQAAAEEQVVGVMVDQVNQVLDALDAAYMEGYSQSKFDQLDIIQQSLLSTQPAVHSLTDTLSDGYKFVKSTAGGAISGATSTLASLVRSGLSSVSRLMGSSNVDPTLVPTLQRLLHLKSSLVDLVKANDKLALERIKKGEVRSSELEDDFKRKDYDIRTHLAVLEEIDMDRNEEGFFVNAEGGAPAEGQARLKALLEECFVLAYELL